MSREVQLLTIPKRYLLERDDRFRAPLGTKGFNQLSSTLRTSLIRVPAKKTNILLMIDSGRSSSGWIPRAPLQFETEFFELLLQFEVSALEKFLAHGVGRQFEPGVPVHHGNRTFCTRTCRRVIVDCYDAMVPPELLRD